MNPIQLHLAINHFPLFADAICFALLLAGYVRNSRDLIRASYFLLIVIGIGAAAAYYTGDPAAHAIKPAAWFSRDAVHEHEEAAEFGLIWSVVLAVLGLAGLFFRAGVLSQKKRFNQVVLFFILFTLSVLARVSYLGGEIRHTEIKNPPRSVPEAGAEGQLPQ